LLAWNWHLTVSAPIDNDLRLLAKIHHMTHVCDTQNRDKRELKHRSSNADCGGIRPQAGKPTKWNRMGLWSRHRT
jgi:hypothetical protein